MRRRTRVAVMDDMPIGGGVLGAMLTRLGCEIVTLGRVQDDADTDSRSRPDVIFASVGYRGVRHMGSSVPAPHRTPLVSYGPVGRAPAESALPSDVHIQEPLRLADVSRALRACVAIDRPGSPRSEQHPGTDVEWAITARAWDGLAIEIAAFRHQDRVGEPADCARLAHRIVSSASILDLRDLTSACMGFGSCLAQGWDLRPARARVLSAMADAEAAGRAWPGRREKVAEAPVVDCRSPPSW